MHQIMSSLKPLISLYLIQTTKIYIDDLKCFPFPIVIQIQKNYNLYGMALSKELGVIIWRPPFWPNLWAGYLLVLALGVVV